MSRVNRRRVLRDVSHRGSLGVARRKRNSKERKEWKSSLGREGEKCEGCGEGEGVEQGRTSCARSNDGDAWHPNGTDDGACLTLAGDPSPHDSPQNVISRNVTRQLHREREFNSPCLHTLHLGNMHLRGGVVEDKRRVIVPIPFRRHTDSRPQRPDLKRIRHFIHPTTHHA